MAKAVSLSGCASAVGCSQMLLSWSFVACMVLPCNN